MRRSDIKNKKLMSALTIGISAMMALSTPISAYANENVSSGDGEENNNPPQPSTAQVSENVAEPVAVTQQAQDQADVVQSVTADTNETAPQQDVTQSSEVSTDASASSENVSAVSAVQEAAQAILDFEAQTDIQPVVVDAADEAKELADDAVIVGPVAEQVIKEVTEAAQAVYNDSSDVTADGEPTAVAELESAAADMDVVKDELKEADAENAKAEEAVVKIEESSKEAFGAAKEADEWAGNILADTTDATTMSEDLMAAINGAQSIEAANKAYEDYGQLVNDITAEDSLLRAKQEYYNSILAQYNTALDALRQAENELKEAELAYAKRLGNAKTQTSEVQEKMASAEQKVNNLLEVVSDAQQALADDAENARIMNETFHKIKGATQWENKRNIVREYVENFIIHKKADEVTWQFVQGFDHQDYNYDMVSYKEDGKTVTRYFNIDNLDKLDKGNKFGDLGNSWGVVAYEKSEEEVKANDALVKKYGNYFNDERRNLANQGFYEVYAYGDEDDRKYVVKEEFDRMVESGEVTEADGVYSAGDYEVTKIVQNKNNLLHDANVFVIAEDHDLEDYYIHDGRRDKKFQEKMMKALMYNHSKEEAERIFQDIRDANYRLNKYMIEDMDKNYVKNDDGTYSHKIASTVSVYQVAVDSALSEVKEAQEEAVKLSDMIDDLYKERKRRTVLAKDVLEISDMVSFLGLEAEGEEAEKLNQMTVSEAIALLGDKLNEANQKVEDAGQKLSRLQSGYDSALTSLNEVIARLTPTVIAPAANRTGGASSGSEASSTETTDAETTDAATPTFATFTTTVQAASGGGRDTAVEISDSNGTTQVSENPEAPGLAVVNASATALGNAAVQDNSGASGAGGSGAADLAESTGATTTIVDEEVALSDAVEQSDELSFEKTVTIADEDVALSGTPDIPAPPKKMSWWWLVIILLLGERGRELYAKYHKDLEDR
ncbi:hypothetical protein [Butyrivibrio sp. INlla14]|uniref:hypothetical protein n=1 Tax=Butyrivibrio sp. INlla14 TaxID=1520808 RepID=UPI0008772D9E|nr:hypothetical protein [Butyrivibrio sp. INlla14]SCY16118.1 hypothetical protein SAMN02910371_01288 [Butyrivibrio sp. INlla14]